MRTQLTPKTGEQIQLKPLFDKLRGMWSSYVENGGKAQLPLGRVMEIDFVMSDGAGRAPTPT